MKKSSYYKTIFKNIDSSLKLSQTVTNSRKLECVLNIWKDLLTLFMRDSHHMRKSEGH